MTAIWSGQAPFHFDKILLIQNIVWRFIKFINPKEPFGPLSGDHSFIFFFIWKPISNSCSWWKFLSIYYLLLYFLYCQCSCLNSYITRTIIIIIKIIFEFVFLVIFISMLVLLIVCILFLPLQKRNKLLWLLLKKYKHLTQSSNCHSWLCLSLTSFLSSVQPLIYIFLSHNERLLCSSD